jgi:hypothetical protein
MVAFLTASRIEHSVALWHPAVAYFIGADTIASLPELTKVSTPITVKQIHPSTARDCYGFPTSSKRFFSVCAGNIYIAYTPSFVWIEPSESNSLNRGCHSQFHHSSNFLGR